MRERYRVLDSEGESVPLEDYRKALAYFCNEGKELGIYSPEQAKFGISMSGVIETSGLDEGTLVSLFHDSGFHNKNLLESASVGNKFRLKKIEDGN